MKLLLCHLFAPLKAALKLAYLLMEVLRIFFQWKLYSCTHHLKLLTGDKKKEGPELLELGNLLL